VPPAKITILGAGVSAAMPRGLPRLGRAVYALDRSLDVLRSIETELARGRDGVLEPHAVEQHVLSAEPRHGRGAGTGRGRAQAGVAPDGEGAENGAVVVDIAIDQGGCFETSRRPRTPIPTYVVDDVVHYCVTNHARRVPRHSTYALNNATLPFVLALANRAGSRRSPMIRIAQRPQRRARQGDAPGSRRGGQRAVFSTRGDPEVGRLRAQALRLPHHNYHNKVRIARSRKGCVREDRARALPGDESLAPRHHGQGAFLESTATTLAESQ